MSLIGDEYNEAIPKLGDLRVFVLREVDENFPNVAELCKRYWERAYLRSGAIGFPLSVDEVGRASNVSGSVVSKLAGFSSFVILGGTVCVECSSERWATNRTAYNNQIKAEVGGAPCRTCEGFAERDANKPLSKMERQDIEKIENRLTEAILLREREQELSTRRQRAIEHMSGIDMASPTPQAEELGLKHAVALAALLRMSLSEDLDSIAPVRYASGRFAPTESQEIELLAELRNRGVIAVASHSDESLFDFETDENGDLYVPAYYPRDVSWWTKFDQIDGEDPERANQTYIESLDDMLDGTGTWPPLWAILWDEDDWRSLWMEISLNECLAYLRLVLGEHGLPFRAGDKTKLVLEETLERFSVAQVWGMIWRAGRDAASFYMRKSSTREHAANTVVGSIQRQAEKAVAEGWELRQYRRDRRLPRSTLSEVFFAKALGAGDAGFESPFPSERITLDSLPDWLSQTR